jgi:hypothetical protein
VIATSSESRRVLTGSVRGKSTQKNFSCQLGGFTMAQGDVQDNTNGCFDYFEIFWMDWQRIGKTALRRDRFGIAFQQGHDGLRKACLKEIASVLV